MEGLIDSFDESSLVIPISNIYHKAYDAADTCYSFDGQFYA